MEYGMRCTCIENEPKKLARLQRGVMGDFEGTHPLTPGRSYLVMTIMVQEARILYLVVNDHNFPRFHPAAFFGPFQSQIPQNWLYRLTDGINLEGNEANLAIQSIWGYPEMVNDADHLENLILGDPEANRIFNQYAVGAPSSGREE